MSHVQESHQYKPRSHIVTNRFNIRDKIKSLYKVSPSFVCRVYNEWKTPIPKNMKAKKLGEGGWLTWSN